MDVLIPMTNESPGFYYECFATLGRDNKLPFFINYNKIAFSILRDYGDVFYDEETLDMDSKV